MEEQINLKLIVEGMSPKKVCEREICNRMYVYMKEICDELKVDENSEKMCEKVRKNYKECEEQWVKCKRGRYKFYF